jgi:hypothetical protein
MRGGVITFIRMDWVSRASVWAVKVGPEMSPRPLSLIPGYEHIHHCGKGQYYLTNQSKVSVDFWPFSVPLAQQRIRQHIYHGRSRFLSVVSQPHIRLYRLSQSLPRATQLCTTHLWAIPTAPVQPWNSARREMAWVIDVGLYLIFFLSFWHSSVP